MKEGIKKLWLKSRMKRVLSIIMVLLMVVSMAPLTALASETPSDSQWFTPNGGVNEAEIRHRDLNKVGDAEILENGTSTLFYDENGEPATADDHSIALSKTATPRMDGDNIVENEFRIDLEVATTRQLKPIEVDAAIVLTIDISASMADGIDGRSVSNANAYQRRINIAKEAASNFLRNYAEASEGIRRYVSIVVFGINAAQILPWTNVNENYGDGLKSALRAVDRIADTIVSGSGNNQNRFSPTSTERIQLEYGTFIQGGLQVSRNAFLETNDGPISGIVNRSIVLLTDGEPNTWIQNNHIALSERNYNTTTTILRGTPFGTNAVSSANAVTSTSVAGIDNAWTHTLAMRNTITRENIAMLYTIAFALGEGPAAQRLADEIATSPEQGFISDDGSSLNKMFENITRDIEERSNAALVVDPMGAYFDFITPDPLPAGVTRNSDGNGFTWNLTAEGVASVTREVNNVIYIVYTFSYYVRFDSIKAIQDGENGGTFFPTNGRTSFTFILDSDAPATEENTRTVLFPIPEVKPASVNLNFTKVNGDNGHSPLSGANFELGLVLDHGYEVIDSATSDEDGSFHFRNVLSRATYFIREIEGEDSIIHDFTIDPNVYFIQIHDGMVKFGHYYTGNNANGIDWSVGNLDRTQLTIDIDSNHWVFANYMKRFEVGFIPGIYGGFVVNENETYLWHPNILSGTEFDLNWVPQDMVAAREGFDFIGWEEVYITWVNGRHGEYEVKSLDRGLPQVGEVPTRVTGNMYFRPVFGEVTPLMPEMPIVQTPEQPEDEEQGESGEYGSTDESVPPSAVIPPTNPPNIPNAPTNNTSPPAIPIVTVPAIPTSPIASLPSPTAPSMTAPPVVSLPATVGGITIAEAEVPNADYVADGEVIGTPIVIEDSETPLGQFGIDSWALVNLIATILTGLITIFLLIGYSVGRKKRSGENEEYTYDASLPEEDAEARRRKGWIRIGSIVPAVAAIILFVFTQDMRLPMVMVDRWTMLQILILLVQAMVGLLAKKKWDREEEEELAQNA